MFFEFMYELHLNQKKPLEQIIMPEVLIPSIEELVGSMELLTTKQVCAYLQIDRSTLSKLVKSGELVSHKIGERLYRYSLCGILFYLLKNKPKAYIERINYDFFFDSKHIKC